MKNITPDKKLTYQFILAVFMIIAGIVLLFMGFYSLPIGEIHGSVLTAFGEICMFSGSIIGIDYRYKAKIYIDKKNGVSSYDTQRDNENKNQPE